MHADRAPGAGGLGRRTGWPGRGCRENALIEGVMQERASLTLAPAFPGKPGETKPEFPGRQ